MRARSNYQIKHFIWWHCSTHLALVIRRAYISTSCTSDACCCCYLVFSLIQTNNLHARCLDSFGPTRRSIYVHFCWSRIYCNNVATVVSSLFLISKLILIWLISNNVEGMLDGLVPKKCWTGWNTKKSSKIGFLTLLNRFNWDNEEFNPPAWDPFYSLYFSS